MRQSKFNYPDEQVYQYLTDQMELAKLEILLTEDEHMQQRLGLFQKVYDFFETLVERAIEEQSTLPTESDEDNDYYGMINGMELDRYLVSLRETAIDDVYQKSVLAEIQDKIFELWEVYDLEQEKKEELEWQREHPDWVRDDDYMDKGVWNQ